MPLIYPVPAPVGRQDIAPKVFQYTVDELPDIVLNFTTATGKPEQVWEKGVFSSKWAHCRVFTTGGKYVFELSSELEAWSWKGEGIGMFSLENHDAGDGQESSKKYPPNWIVVTEAPFFAVGDGVADDTAALQAAFNAAESFKSTIFWPAGTYRITSGLVCGIDTNGKQGISLLGQNSAYGAYDGVSRLMWDGESTIEPALLFGGTDFFVQGITVFANLGRNLFAGIILGNGPNGGNTLHSRSLFKGITITNFNQGIEARRHKYGICIGFPETGRQSLTNLENCTIEDCYLVGAVEAGILLWQGQPINTVINRCQFRGYTSSASPGRFGGLGLYVAGDSSTGVVSSCDFQALECWFLCGGVGGWKFIGGQSENCKTAFVTNGPITRNNNAVSFENMRVTCEGTGKASLGPLAFGEGMHQFFLVYNGAPLILRGNSFSGGLTIPSPFKIQLMSGSTLISEANQYPNPNPFAMGLDYSGKLFQGIFSRGDSSQSNPHDANDFAPLPQLFGALTPSNVVSFVGDSSFESIVVDEKTDSYNVRLDIDSISGNPIVTTPYVTDKTANGFVIRLAQPPGNGSVVVRYTIWR